jgi:diguanylate cyclase (GGDEF)-like protein/PAS domain S-box-containing protein
MFSKGNHKELHSSIEVIGASFAIYEFDNEVREFYLVTANTMYTEVMDIAIERAVGLDVKKLFPRYIEKDVRKFLLDCQENQHSTETEIIIEYKKNRRYWRFIFTPVIDLHNRCNRIINTCIEITDKKILEQKLTLASKRYEAVVQSAYDGIIAVTEDQNISMINESAKYIFGIGEENLIGKPLTCLIPMKFRRKHVEYVNSFKDSLIESRPMQSRASVRGLRRDGTEFPIEVTISKIKIGSNMELTAVVRDISERAKLVEELSKAAREDSLTGIMNRRYFSEVLENGIERSKRFNRNVTLVMFDIDRFKQINDDYGHSCGDVVLIEFVKLVQANLRSIDHFARWGGEEFIVMLTETSLDNALVWAKRIREMTECNMIKYNAHNISITCSFGVSEKSAEHFLMDEMIKAVDEKMYEAKKSGRNSVKY